MTLLPILLAVGIMNPAHAGKKGEDKAGVRLKFNAPLYTIQKDTLLFEGEEVDLFPPTQTNSLTFLNGGNRTEITKLIGEGLEAGAILGFGSSKLKVDGEDAGSASSWNVGITGAYNYKASDGLVIYAQPIITYGSEGTKDADGESLGSVSWLGLGLDAGVRINLAKGVHIDPALEYMMFSGTPKDADGEKVEDTKLKRSSMGARLGLGVKF
jgi:hypothetical protein